VLTNLGRHTSAHESSSWELGLEGSRPRERSGTSMSMSLIDRRNFHLFQPLLYQVATAALSPGDISWPIRSDFLILATRASHSYFGRDELERYDPGLKTIDDAISLTQRLLSAIEHAELMVASKKKEATLTTVVVGGGPTGVEMAGAAAEPSHRMLSSEFRNIDPTTARIVLIEAGPDFSRLFQKSCPKQRGVHSKACMPKSERIPW
jgi:NADH:ubiquinone reductase (H+-translocating)